MICGTTDRHRGGWHPVTLRWTVYLPLTTITIGLLVIFVLLLYRSANDGFIYRLVTPNVLPTTANLVFQYLPIVFGIIYNIVWNWIDLDTKRSEPWFQLSKEHGVRAETSLLSTYPTDFPATVPWQAAKQRQWILFAVSAVTLLVVWVFTPLLGSIFSSQTVAASTLLELPISDGMLNPINSSQNLGLGFLHTAFAAQWLNASLPGFTTAQYVLKPAYIEDNFDVEFVHAQLTYMTTLYGSDLECWSPASIQVNATRGIVLDDGRGCRTLIPIATPRTFPLADISAWHIGWYNDERLDYSLANPQCPEIASGRTLNLWMRDMTNSPNFSDPTQAVALFCEPTYFQQLVQATVSGNDSRVLSIRSMGPKTEFSGFNRSDFEFILASGLLPSVIDDSSNITNHDIPDLVSPNQNPKLSQLPLEMPVTNMIGYIIGASHLPPIEYLDPAVLSTALTDAYQLLFAMAIQSLMPEPSAGSDMTPITVSYQQPAVVISPTIVYILAILIFIIISGSSFSTLKSLQRSINIIQDPCSMSRVVKTVSNNEVIRECSQLMQQKEVGITRKGYNKTYQLSQPQGIVSAPVAPKRVCVDGPSHTTTERSEATAVCLHSGSKQVQPFELAKAVGVGCVVTMSTTLIAITLIQYLITKNFGLPLPVFTDLQTQILFNYLPTTLGTMLDTFWVMVTRIIAILLPFHQLASNLIPARTSLSLSYAALPPQILFWQAAQNGHYKLAVVSIITISANMLTIALNGLFVVKDSTVGFPVTTDIMYHPSTNASKLSPYGALTDALDVYPSYIVKANLSSNANLPAWLGEHRYYIPTTLPVGNDAARFTVPTIGISASLECRHLSTEPSDAMYEMSFDSTGTQAEFTVTFNPSDGVNKKCFAPNFLTNDTGYLTFGGNPAGVMSAEVFTVLEQPLPPNTTDAIYQTYCDGWFLAGWLRTNNSMIQTQYSNVEAKAGPDPFNISSTFLLCRPSVYKTPYSVTVDGTGTILSFFQIGSPDSSETISQNFKAISDHIISIGMQSPFANGHPIWHNTTSATDWFSYLMKLATKSTRFLDSTLPPPMAETAILVLNDMYSRLWAATMYLESSILEEAQPNTNQQRNATTFPTSMGAQRIEKVKRLYTNPTMFWIAFSLLTWDIIVALWLYTTVPRAFMPHMPTSIASILSFFEGSHCLDDLISDEKAVSETSSVESIKSHVHTYTHLENSHADDEDDDNDERDTSALNPYKSDPRGQRGQPRTVTQPQDEVLYAFGPFIGTDGHERVGIDKYPHAVPLNLRRRRRIFGWE